MLVKNVKCTNHRYTPIRDYDNTPRSSTVIGGVV